MARMIKNVIPKPTKLRGLVDSDLQYVSSSTNRRQFSNIRIKKSQYPRINLNFNYFMYLLLGRIPAVLQYRANP